MEYNNDPAKSFKMYNMIAIPPKKTNPSKETEIEKQLLELAKKQAGKKKESE